MKITSEILTNKKVNNNYIEYNFFKIPVTFYKSQIKLLSNKKQVPPVNINSNNAIDTYNSYELYNNLKGIFIIQLSQFNVNPFKHLKETKTLNIQDRFSIIKIWAQDSGQEITLKPNNTIKRLLVTTNQIIIYFT